MKKEKNMSIRKYLEWISEKDKYVFFRLMYPQDERWNVLSIILRENIPIIHLTRNIFSKSMSRMLKGVGPDDTIKINHNSLAAEMARSKHRIERYNKILSKSKSPVLKFKYENIIGHTEGLINNEKQFGAFNVMSDQKTYLNTKESKQITNLLGLPEFNFYTNVTKRIRRPYEKIVKNWKAIKPLSNNKIPKQK